jgi:hypothetical protein
MRANIVISGILAGWLAGPAAAQLPSTSPPTSSDVPMAETANTFGGAETISLNKCYARGEIITCKFVLTRNRSGPVDYVYDPRGPLWASFLIDNFKISHQLIGGYLLNGRDQHVKRLNLSRGDSVWFSQDYGGAPTDRVDQARIVFPQSPGQGAFELHAAVEKAE